MVIVYSGNHVCLDREIEREREGGREGEPAIDLAIN